MAASLTVRPIVLADVRALADLYLRAYDSQTQTFGDAIAEMSSAFDGTWGVWWPEASPAAWKGQELVAVVQTVHRPSRDLMPGAPDCPWLIDVFHRSGLPADRAGSRSHSSCLRSDAGSWGRPSRANGRRGQHPCSGPVQVARLRQGDVIQLAAGRSAAGEVPPRVAGQHRLDLRLGYAPLTQRRQHVVKQVLEVPGRREPRDHLRGEPVDVARSVV
jgi:hypothetical protein